MFLTGSQINKLFAHRLRLWIQQYNIINLMTCDVVLLVRRLRRWLNNKAELVYCIVNNEPMMFYC